MKLIILILGLGIGFGSGIYYGVHHPVEAANIADQEQQAFLRGKLEATQAIKQKLDQIPSNPAGAATPGSGFLGSIPSGSASDALAQVKSVANQQLQDVQNQLANKK